MTELAEAFIAYATQDRERSPHTIARYRAVLAQLDNPATATQDDIQAWWESRYHLSPSTRANELACLRSFYRWAGKYDHRADDPTRRLDPPKIPNRLPRMIGRADLTRLLGELTDDTPDLRRAIALGVYGGLRVSEAAAAQWSDVDLEQRRLYVRGKGRKERAVALSVVLLDYLLPERAGNIVTGGATKQGYSGAVLQRRVNRLMERHGIDHSFHDFRKRGASLALSKGMNPVAVRSMFGWSSMETVSSYAVVGSGELDLVAEAMV